MFAVEIPRFYFYGLVPGLSAACTRKVQSAPGGRATNESARAATPEQLICDSLATMLPSTAEEIALSAGLEPATVGTCLDELARRYRVMFNPLTKRYSLPKLRPSVGLAA